MRDILFKEIENKLNLDENTIILTADLGYGIFEKIEKKYPKQFINVGVAEQNLIGIGSGLASEGKKVIVYSIANFPILRCLEQIRNDAAYHNVNMLIVSCGVGFTYGQLGVSHHLTEDISIMNSVPNVNIFSPAINQEIKYLFKKVMKKNGLSYLRIDKRGLDIDNLKNNLFDKPLLLQKGKGVVIISTGTILEESFKAAEVIKEKFNFKISIISINNFSAKYLDELVKHIKSHKLIITLEEHNLNGGLGSIINNLVINRVKNFKYLKIKNIAIDNKFCSKIGDQKYLRKINGIDSVSIVKIIVKNYLFIKNKK